MMDRLVLFLDVTWTLSFGAVYSCCFPGRFPGWLVLFLISMDMCFNGHKSATGDVFHPCLDQGFQNIVRRLWHLWQFQVWMVAIGIFMLLLLLLRKINDSAVSQED
jgi:hypothetical protein